MDHDQLIDLTRRALKLAREKTTDPAPQQHMVDAREYTSGERHNLDRAMLMGQPATGRLRIRAARSGRLLHQDGDGAIHPADQNI